MTQHQARISSSRVTRCQGGAVRLLPQVEEDEVYVPVVNEAEEVAVVEVGVVQISSCRLGWINFSSDPALLQAGSLWIRVLFLKSELKKFFIPSAILTGASNICFSVCITIFYF